MTDTSIRQWYESEYDEDTRLEGFSVEWLRHLELIGRVLPPAPARVADIAGGTGRYAAWLAAQGYGVSLLDLVPTHVEAAERRLAERGLKADCVVGDARALPWADETFEVVMVMGALYHLQERDDRLAVLAEARRILKPQGALVTAHVCRWASLFDGYYRGMVLDPEFRAIVATDLATGAHENPNQRPHWFTSAYFHTPDEVRDEVTTSGFVDVQVLAVEGFTSTIEVPEPLRSGDGLTIVLDHLRATEAEPALLGASAHLVSLSRKP